MAEYAKMEDVLNALCTCECEDKMECLDYVLISNVPTIDIIHCSECKYWCGEDEEGGDCKRSGDWFCADGERSDTA